MKGSSPKTREQLKRDGTFRADRHEGRIPAGSLPPAADAPDWLPLDVAAQYQSIVDRVSLINGWATITDTETIAALAQMHIALMNGELEFKDYPTFIRLSRELAMTPDSRLRMRIPNQKADADPADELMARRKKAAA